MLIQQSRITVETKTGPLGIEIIQPSPFLLLPCPPPPRLRPHLFTHPFEHARPQRLQGTRTLASQAS